MSWQACTIADLINSGEAEIQTGPFGTQLEASDYTPDGTPVINVRNIGYGNLRSGKLEYVPEKVSERLSQHILKEHDIVFGRKGAVDRHLLVSKDHHGWMQGSDCIRLRLSGRRVTPKFLSYAFLGAAHKQWMITQSSNKATMASLNHDVIVRISLSLPNPIIQKRIADILSAYEDLIENNRRRMQLMEQAARLLYEEWFVRLRFPGHEHVKIKGGVPEGWERLTISAASSFLSRGITPKYDAEAKGIVINQKCIRNKLVDMNLARHQSKEVPQNKLVQYGDVLINSTGQGTLGRVAQFLDEIENCTVDSHITIARPAAGIPRHYFGHRISLMEDYLSTMGRGATNQTELSRDTIGNIPLVLPKKSIAEDFELIMSNTSGQIQILISQNQKLMEARDLLLPRLMNGELSV